MSTLIGRYDAVTTRLDAASVWAIPTLTRLVFLAVFFYYFWNSATTKLDGLFQPSFGAFSQIFPKAAEALSYDITQASFLQKAVMVLGAWAEFALPVAIVLGIFTRFAAVGMIGFIIVQSLTDIYGHGISGADIGAWFDNVASSVIVDQRTLWVFLMVILILRGAGPLSIDGLVSAARNRLSPAQPA